MTIRKKLILSNIGMIVIPGLLAALMASIFFHAVIHPQGNGFPENNRFSSSGQSDWKDGFLFAVSGDPGLLSDERFLSETDQKLAKMDMAMAIERDGSLAYVSPRLEQPDGGADLLQLLSRNVGDKPRRHGPPWMSNPTLKLDGTSYEVEQLTMPVQGSNRHEQTVYLLADRSGTIHFFRTFVPVLFLSFLLGIALTNGLLSYFVSRSIVRPLRSLKLAAQRIKEGDLDQALEARKDEIGQAIAAFEEMRLRLRESLATQLQYEENRKELLSNISHDLRTPIAAISGCVEGLQSGIADTKEKQIRYVEMIRRKTADMSRMIEELFLFSKLDLQRIPFDFETVDLTAYLRDLADEWRHDPRMADVDLKTELNEDSPVLIRADREKLGRAMANILDNSLKHMDKADQKITIELRTEGRQTATVLIRDNGRGIRKEELPHIFERFYRADPSRRSDSGGSGLGLAIVKQIMETHGGKAEAESEEGKGTTLALTLRQAGPDQTSEAPHERGGRGNEREDPDH